MASSKRGDNGDSRDLAKSKEKEGVAALQFENQRGEVGGNKKLPKRGSVTTQMQASTVKGNRACGTTQRKDLTSKSCTKTIQNDDSSSHPSRMTVRWMPDSTSQVFHTQESGVTRVDVNPPMQQNRQEGRLAPSRYLGGKSQDETRGKGNRKLSQLPHSVGNVAEQNKRISCTSIGQKN
ncbi:hypothetical protein J5N97_002845 [Dioscorea zingiberensis]|uniref:Uncharacterized protein n=1 Tax=Dioscorea zingiberensis TaxID=325984 RepID=A0A9D5D4N8_9LILI|nr:hypothetical protein J5N97_002845 [Dioscorea zingiberensis]